MGNRCAVSPPAGKMRLGPPPFPKGCAGQNPVRPSGSANPAPAVSPPFDNSLPGCDNITVACESTMTKILACVLFLILTSGTPLFAGWPFNSTPEVHGIVRDSKTKKPIKDAKIMITYWKSYPLAGENFRTLSRGFYDIQVYSNADGVFLIPRHMSFHIFSCFGYFRLHYIQHTLYKMKNSELGDSLPVWSRKTGPASEVIEWDIQLDPSQNNKE